MGVNALILVAFAAWILSPGVTPPEPDNVTVPTVAAPATSTPSASLPAESSVPTKQRILDLEGLRFGICAPDVPWSSGQLARLVESVNATPTMIQFFVQWGQPYPRETAELSFHRGAIPVVSWEPWAGLEHGTDQPDYALSRIIDGDFDEYIEAFAAKVRDHGWPVAIRFAHEMNGHWYPWSERNSGNRPGEYVQAWHHLHAAFQEAGATNVIWLWSPNILRPVPDVSLEALYPGDDYVDWVGLVGYAVEESTAAAVFDPTVEALRQFTGKPIVITETGAQPGEHKAAWIADFFVWLSRHPDVIGFIWFEYTPQQGGNADWRFTETPETIEAFRDGIARNRLAASPLGLPAS